MALVLASRWPVLGRAASWHAHRAGWFAATRLLDRHHVLFVVLDDQELTDIAAAPPESADDVSRAVTAAELLRERRIVVTRLRHAGFHVLESPHNRVGLKLVAYYIDLKRRNLL